MLGLAWAIMTLGAMDGGARDLAQFKRFVKDLSIACYQGRDYTDEGIRKAGKHIYRAFEKARIDEVRHRPFTLDISTFCGDLEMWSDGWRLKTGSEFSILEYSPGVKGVFHVYFANTAHFFKNYGRIMVAMPFLWITHKAGAVVQRINTNMDDWFQKGSASPHYLTLADSSSTVSFEHYEPIFRLNTSCINQ